MSMLRTPLEVFRLLPKTNCGDCGLSTCLAFAAAVIKQETNLAQCPHLDREIVARHSGSIERPINLELVQEATVRELRLQAAKIDLPARAKKLGARTAAGKVVVTCLGREFEIDGEGNVASTCHTHAWFSIPLLHYLLQSEGAEPLGRWMPLRELEGGASWAALFERRCEQPLQHLADRHPELFGDLVSLFSGAACPSAFGADISVLLHPLPKVPILISYWKPEGGMESKLHVFFDATAARNLPVESLFTLGTGIVRMLEKIMQKHANISPELA